VIVLPPGLRDAIAQQAQAEYPEECCGLMLGRLDDDRKVVEQLLPLSNARESEARRNRYLIGPAEMLRGERQARALGLDIVGIYHSHPDVASVPSQFDLDHAWPTYSYVIVTSTATAAGPMRSWVLRDDRTAFDEELLTEPAL
jgi:proteasome lid subunit RPN8/RPN11